MFIDNVSLPFYANSLLRELIPLKFRHIGVCIADSVGFLTTVVGPVAGRYATLQGGNTWIWLYWADAILCVVAFALICWLYKVSLRMFTRGFRILSHTAPKTP